MKKSIWSKITELWNITPKEHRDKSWRKFYKYADWRTYLIKEIIENVVIILVLLIVIREGIGEFRFIPSESMEPTLVVEDKLFVEKFSKRFRKELKKGDIAIFYPPKEATNDEDVLKYDPFSIFSRLTGLPFLPQPEAYIKRIVATAGDKVEVIRSVGLYINGKLVDEPYHEGSEDYLPNYNLRTMNDIGKDLMNCGRRITLDYNSNEPIIVPKDHYMVLGDNRNHSFDSHCWGFLPKKRLIGRAAFLIYRPLNEKPIL